MVADIHRRVEDRLERAGHRYTQGRAAIVDALVGSPDPVSIGELMELAPALSLSSTYRNLGVLEGVGAVHRIVTSDDNPRYELADAITERHHHHLICTKCGVVRDFTLPGDVEQALDRSSRRAARAHG